MHCKYVIYEEKVEKIKLKQNNNDKKKYLLGGGIVTDGVSIFFENGAVLIEDGKIARIGKTEKMMDPGLKFVDVGGRIVLQGLLNAHHHLYSSMAVGVTPLGQTDKFKQILENLWWPWDKALDEDAVYFSALLGAIDSLKHGVTTIFDHHASMNFVRGSLSVIADAINIAGMKALLCFETSDRMGERAVEEQIAENIEFYESNRDSDRIAGAFGLHANLTLSQNTLKKVEKLKPHGMPIHVHCGEDISDLTYCVSQGYEGPIQRLHSFGLVTQKSILAHCIHLGDADYELLRKIRPIVVSNPESNANNLVGSMDRSRIDSYILGTDGMTGDMIATSRAHYILGKKSGIEFGEFRRAFFDDRYRAQRAFFPKTGSLKPGSAADIAVLDYIPVAPIDIDNLMGHIVFGAKNGRAYLTIIDGEILCRQGQITFADESEIVYRAKNAAKRQIGRFYG